MELHIGRHSSIDGDAKNVQLNPLSEFRVRNSEVSDPVPPLYTYYDFPMVFLKPTPEVLDTVEIMNITPELESLLGIHTTQFINKFHAELSGFRYYDSSFDMFNLRKFIIKQFLMTAGVVDGIKRYDGVTAKEFSELFSRYETSLLKDCIIRSQMLQDASSPMSLKREFTLQVKTDAEFAHEFDGESSQCHEKRAGSTRYRSIQSFIDRFIEKNGNIIGDEVKLDQYGMPRLRAFITLQFFQMAEASGLMRVMDDTNIIDMLMYFEEPLLRDCIQEIQNQGPIQKELIKTGISLMQEINLDCAKQGAAIVVSYVLSSSKPGVVLDVMMFALLMGITCSILANFLRKHKSVSKVLTNLGLMGIASSVILSFAALFPQRWSSPIPYLFGGLGLMLGAIALALIILACSYRKSASTDHDDEEKSQKQIHDLQHEEMEPRVVIMAGDTNPTHLAKPVAATRFSTEKV